jgi:hypothetical protein
MRHDALWVHESSTFRARLIYVVTHLIEKNPSFLIILKTIRMIPTLTFTIASLAATLALARGAIQPPATQPVLGQGTPQGCFGWLSDDTGSFSSIFMSVGLCVDRCRGQGDFVAALQQINCTCGNIYPPPVARVEDSECNISCPGYAHDACGGYEVYSVYNTGVELNVHQDQVTEQTMSACDPVGTMVGK